LTTSSSTHSTNIRADGRGRPLKILFITPTGNRTGSEVALFNIVARLDQAKFRPIMMCRGEGQLLTTLPPGIPSIREGLRLKLISKAYSTIRNIAGSLRSQEKREWLRTLDVETLTGSHDVLVQLLHRKYSPDLWYINTVAQPGLIHLARRMGVTCVVHSHELEQLMWPLSARDVEALIEYPKLIIACSEASARVLNVLGRSSALEVCTESIDVGAVRSTEGKARAIRRDLGIADNAFVWLMSGSTDPNKDPVRYVDIAHHVLETWPSSHFVWLGGRDNGYSLYAKARARSLGISDKISWISARKDDYFDYLDLADGFALVSWRDSFPLVMIEAAALGKPIVSFDSGGVREFVIDGMGEVVRSCTAEDLAEAMCSIMASASSYDPRISVERARSYDASVLVRRWEEIVSRYFGNTGTDS
jgi:L-malate glycosyltransferase